MEVQFFHDAAAVGVDGVDGQVEGRRDFFVRFAFGDHLQDFALAGTEEIEGVGDVFAVVGEDRIRDGGTEIAFASGDGADGGEEIDVDGVLEEVAAGAGAEDFADVDRIFVHAEGEDAGLRVLLHDAAGGFDAVEFGHGDIHDNHVGLQFAAHRYGVAAVAGFANNFHVGLGAEDHAEALADDGVVID